MTSHYFQEKTPYPNSISFNARTIYTFQPELSAGTIFKEFRSNVNKCYMSTVYKYFDKENNYKYFVSQLTLRIW